MKRKFIYTLLAISLSTILTACGHEHTWVEATCTQPKHCSECEEIEDNILEHSWVEVTCAEAKHCSKCGITEGEALPHTLTEANFQQPATCEVCGETDGEKLQADFEKYGWEYVSEVDKEYTFINQCLEAPEELTTGKIVFSDYEIFASKEGYEAKEGYEWRSITYTIIFDDKNANEYGHGGFYMMPGSFYDMVASLDGDYNESGDYAYTINYNGNDMMILEKNGVVLQDEWIWINDENAYFIKKVRQDFCVPIGYDGMILSVMDAERRKNLPSDMKTIEDVNPYLSNENTVTFRLQ